MQKPVYSRTETVIAAQPWEPGMPSRRRVERTPDEPIARGEFEAHRKATCEWRKSVDATLQKIDAALFSETGLVVVAKKIDQHIDAVCNIAKWVRASLIAVATLVIAVAGAAKAMGWV
jgi:hypothetical protein